MEKKKGFWKLLALLLCIMMELGTAMSFIPESKAEDLQATVDGYTYTYTVNNNNATITKVDPKPTGDYTIPDKLNDYPVTVIGEKVFQECGDLENVIIPNDVTDIGSYAFYCCHSIKNLTIPDSVQNIGDNAFCGCFNLTILTVGKGVKKIGEEAFSNIDELKEVRISDLAAWCAIEFTLHHSNPLAVNFMDGNFSDSKAVNLYINGEKIEHLVIPDDVKSIGDFAFACCKLKTVMIPPGVEKIGNFAFFECTMMSATISEDVTSIGLRAFDSCSNLKTLYYIGNLDDLNRVSGSSSLPEITLAPRVTVNISPVQCGLVEMEGCGTGLIDRTATVTAIALPGYSFVNWTDAGGKVVKDESGKDAGAKYSFIVTGNTKLTANFKRDESVIDETNSIEGAKVKVSDQVYTGKKLKPALKVTLGEKVLELNTDYTVKWKNNRGIGKATVILTGIGEYSGTVKKSFNIIPQPVKAIKLEDKQGKLFAEWKIKKGSDIDGYELEYWTKKDKSDKQESEITSKSIRKLEIKKIKPGKPCYVRIRTYKLIKEKKYYSEWSETVNQTNL